MSQAKRDVEAFRKAGVIITEDHACEFCGLPSPVEEAHGLCVSRAQINAIKKFADAVDKLAVILTKKK